MYRCVKLACARAIMRHGSTSDWLYFVEFTGKTLLEHAFAVAPLLAGEGQSREAAISARRKVVDAIMSLIDVLALLCARRAVHTTTKKATKDLYRRVTSGLRKFHKVFPVTEQSIMFHLLLHKPQQIYWWGPAQFHWMFPFDRLVGRCKKLIHRRRGCEANLIRAWRVMHFASVLQGDVRLNNMLLPKHDDCLLMDLINPAPATLASRPHDALTVSAPPFDMCHVGRAKARNTQWVVPCAELLQLRRLTRTAIHGRVCKVLRGVKVGGLERGCAEAYKSTTLRRKDGVRVARSHLASAIAHGVLMLPHAEVDHDYFVGRIQFFVRAFAKERSYNDGPLPDLLVCVCFFPFAQRTRDDEVNVTELQSAHVYLRADALGPMVGFFKRPPEARLAVIPCYHDHIYDTRMDR